MEKGKFPKLYGKSIRYFLICATGILCFVALGIYPRQKSMAELDTEAVKLETEIKAQKALRPVFANLLKRAKVKSPTALPFPEKTKLDRAKAVMIPDAFREIAQMSGLQLVDVAPDLKTVVKGGESLSVNVHLSGDFHDFRNFLIRMEQIPYLKHVERVQIEPAEGVKEFRLKVWLALEP